MYVVPILKRINLSYVQENLFESSSEQIAGTLKEAAAAAVDDVSCQKSIAHISNAPYKVLPKLEAEVNSDRQKPMGTLKCSGQDEQDEKSSEQDVREPPLQSTSGNESDDSDIVEHDVSTYALHWFVKKYLLCTSLSSNPFYLSCFFLCILPLKVLVGSQTKICEEL